MGAGEFCEAALDTSKYNLVIAADGGLNHLERLGIAPHLLVADFDSLQNPLHRKLSGAETVPYGIIELAQQKDDTDTSKAVKIGLELGCKEFHLYGCSGGRLDHTLANLQLLVYLSKRNARGFLYDNGFVATAATNDEVSFGKDMKGTVSVFSFDGTAQGVTLEGLKYPLSNATLTGDFPLGVSNEFIGKKSTASVKSGSLLIITKA